MTLAQNLLSNLGKLPAAAPGVAQASHEGWTATVDAVSPDAHSVLSREIRLERATPGAGSVGAWAERVAERTAKLGDPLKVIEVDAGDERALLRSKAPRQREGKIVYQELLLTGTSQASLTRQQASNEPGEKRQQVPFAMTHEALEDFVGAVAE